MKVMVVCVGKLKEKYWRDAIAEYSKRLSRYMKLEIIELADEKAPENMSDAQAAEVKEREGQRILKNVKDDAFAVALAVEGKMLSSEELAEFMAKKSVGGVSHIVFIIGGSLGLSPAVMRRPVSVQVNFITARPSEYETSSEANVTAPPARLYFTALPPIFCKTCFR